MTKTIDICFIIEILIMNLLGKKELLCVAFIE